MNLFHKFLGIINRLQIEKKLLIYVIFLTDSDKKRNARLEPSGNDFSSFVEDSIALFPKEKLTALYDHKMEDHEEFRTAIENLQSEEWDDVFSALWDSPTFEAEVQTLADNGINVHVLLQEVVAIFGQ